MRFSICLIVACIFLSKANAQNFSHEFGKVSLQEAKLKFYEKDSTAEALVLFDYGMTEFVQGEEGFDILHNRKTRIKVFKESGQKWGFIEIPLYHASGYHEEILEIEAYTYNYDQGKLHQIPLDLDQVYEEKVNKYWTRKKFTFPKLKPGSVIEYRYVLKTPSRFKLSLDWDFQKKIPSLYSEFEFRIVPFYTYSYYIQGTGSLDVFEEFEDKSKPKGNTMFGGFNKKYYDNVFRFGLKNIPAFQSEDYITSIDDYLIKVYFQMHTYMQADGYIKEVISTWEKLSEDMLKEERFGRYINKCENQADKILDVEKVMKLPVRDRFEYVLNKIKSEFAWDGTNDKYAHQKLQSLLSSKKGNRTELNLLALGVMRKVGIEAFPVLISTRDHGKIKHDYPFLDFFNTSVICAKFESYTILTDATSSQCSNYRLPLDCINDQGLVLKKKEAFWVKLESPIMSERQTNVNLSIEDDQLKAQVLSVAKEYEALMDREAFSQEEIPSRILEFENYTVDKSSVFNRFLDAPKRPFIHSYNLSAEVPLVQGKLYIAPFLELPLAENKLQQKSRSYPVDLIYPSTQTFESKILIPEGFVVDYLPENVEFEKPGMKLSYSIKHLGQSLQVSLQYSFEQTIYSPEEYSNIQTAFDLIVEKGNEQVVLKKKPE